MKQGKYIIGIERDAIRCSFSGRKSTKAFPKAFGNKEKNIFISTIDEDDDSVLRLKVSSSNYKDAYIKMQEVTNVVVNELHLLDEMIYASSFYNDEMLAKGKISLQIDKEFYEELKEDYDLPESLEEAYLKIKENMEVVADLAERNYGKIKVKANKKDVVISNIRLNIFDGYGISQNDLMFFVSSIFMCLRDKEIKNLKDLQKALLETDKKLNLKCVEGIEAIIEELKEKVSREAKEKEYSKEAILKLSEKYNEYAYNQRYCMQKHKKLVAESVAIIKDAIANGIDFEVLNENKSTVEFRGHGNIEFVIEGNKTDRDNYIFPIITDDKYISKQEMKEAGLSVPEAILLDSDMDRQDIEELVSEYYNKKLVVKPRNTNYGTGITVFSKKATKAQILNAIDYAFKFDNNVLIEEYKKGMEYRFLVINGRVLSVCHRRIASVVGDGKSTIKQLIRAKNKEPWHALTGTPVKMDQPVVEFLKLQELTYDSVIPANKRVFLRTNSNCSTGGESVDYTDIMPTKFKKIAEKAARVFDAKICGVDIIIDDMEKDEYSIIEINDNPGYSINEWPYEGRGEKIGVAILKLLNLMA